MDKILNSDPCKIIKQSIYLQKQQANNVVAAASKKFLFSVEWPRVQNFPSLNSYLQEEFHYMLKTNET